MRVIDQKLFKKMCTGCAACSNICPSKAISLQTNAKGFLYPIIDDQRCNHCGLCLKVCSIQETDFCLQIPKRKGIFIGEDNIREKSSSGGLFYYLAQTALKEGGVVFGAFFDQQDKKVKHISSDDIPLEDIMRSKYVQSEIGECYLEVKNQLRTGREVLFCGTPCQNYALTKYLGKNYNNLLLIDFVCHGVPGTGIFEALLRECSEKTNKNIIQVTFREKDDGWRNQRIKFYFEDGSIMAENSKDNWYYNSFLQNITLRESCLDCQFPQKHFSDITIFDYWGAKNDDDKGVSAFICNTGKGSEILKSSDIKQFCIDSNIDVSAVCIPHNKIKSYGRGLYRKIYYRAYKKGKAIKCLKRECWFIGTFSKIKRCVKRAIGK